MHFQKVQKTHKKHKSIQAQECVTRCWAGGAFGRVVVGATRPVAEKVALAAATPDPLLSPSLARALFPHTRPKIPTFTQQGAATPHPLLSPPPSTDAGPPFWGICSRNQQHALLEKNLMLTNGKAFSYWDLHWVMPPCLSDSSVTDLLLLFILSFNQDNVRFFS